MRIPAPAVELYRNYQKIIGEINTAWTTFNLVEALSREMRSTNVMSCEELKDEVSGIYEELLSVLGSVKKPQNPKEAKKTMGRLEKLEKKFGMEKGTFDSVSKLKKYVEQRRNWVWNRILGEEQKKPSYKLSETIANFRLIPPISVILGMGVRDAYQSVSDTVKNERETIERIIEFVKNENPEIEDRLRRLEHRLGVLRELAQKLEKVAKNHKKFERILETPYPLFQGGRFLLEEICQEYSPDPFFRNADELVETYIDLAFWEDEEIPAVKKLVNDLVRQSVGKKVPSRNLVERLKEVLKKKGEDMDVESAARIVFGEYMARFNLFWQVQMMSVELALLAPNLWKKYRKTSNRVNEYENIKMDISNIEKDLPQLTAEDGVPVMELGAISKRFFGGVESIAEFFGDEVSVKLEEKENEVEVKLCFPWMENLKPGSRSLRSWLRAYTWKRFTEENEKKFEAYKKILGLYGPGAEKEFERFVDHLREVIREGK